MDNDDGTVTDTCTGLMWQQATASPSIEYDPDQDGRLTWQEALQYCEGLDLGGHTDWRLPNVKELQSIVDYGRFNPSIDPVFNAESSWYWSSSSNVDETVHAWGVDFHHGLVDDGNKDGYRTYVRAIRGGL